MRDVGTAPLQVVGYEGVFGCLAMFCVLLPIVQHTPGEDGTGLHEDTWETLHVSPAWLSEHHVFGIAACIVWFAHTCLTLSAAVLSIKPG